jgi:DNA helicase-2/ATP-dependent DNA helicase PcrA
MKDINNLPDVASLMDIERDFKIYAGPGSGKTTWLVSHLENVLKKSKRLGKTGRIACITYTNVAAEELLSRLQCNKDRFDISTIHSFLYRNIIKPFSYLIEKDDQGDRLFDITKLNGHEEHHVQMDKLRN